MWLVIRGMVVFQWVSLTPLMGDVIGPRCGVWRGRSEVLRNARKEKSSIVTLDACSAAWSGFEITQLCKPVLLERRP